MRSRAARRSSTSPPRRTSTARSPSPTRSCAPTRSARTSLLEAARERGLRYVQVSTDEVYGSIEEGSFTEESPLEPSSPYSATKAGADLLVSSYFHTYGLQTLICRGSNNYGPLPVPREADPADGPQRPARRPAAGLRRRPAGAQLALRRGLRARHRRTCSSTASPGEVYNVGGPDECTNIEVVTRIVELTGADESLDRVRHRPPRPRPPLLAVVREDPRARLGAAQVHFAEGLEQHRRAGTATTPRGGSRSARATTASTTSASTAAASARLRADAGYLKPGGADEDGAHERRSPRSPRMPDVNRTLRRRRLASGPHLI